MRKLLFIAGVLFAAALAAPETALAMKLMVGVDLSAITFNRPMTLSATPLPQQVFYGKHIVVPIQVSKKDAASIDTKNLKVEIIYQLVDMTGTPFGPSITVPIQFQQSPSKPNTIVGAAFIPRQDLLMVRNGGGMRYYFRAQQGSKQALFGSSVAPFETHFIDTMQVAVNHTDRIQVRLPDTNILDHPTTFDIPDGAFDAPGVLTIHSLNPDTGQNYQGQPPVIEYAVSLNAGGGLPLGSPSVFSSNPGGGTLAGLVMTPLSRPFQISLSYPANPDGTVALDINGNSTAASNLAPYCYDPAHGWRLAGRPDIDPTLHTVTFTATTLQTCALFATGPVGATDVRPIQRTITPNGDGINDTADFIGLGVGDDVHIFDIRGRRVATLQGPNPKWAATDDAGKPVESGVYLYQYTLDGKRVSGVINVVR